MKSIHLLELIAHVAHGYHSLCGDHVHGFWCGLNIILLIIGVVKVTTLALEHLQRLLKRL